MRPSPGRLRSEEGGDRNAQRGAPATRRRLSVTRRPFRGHDRDARGYRSAQRQETNQGHRSSIIISKSKNAIGARALYSPLSPPASSYTWPFIRARWRYRPRSTPRASTRSVRRGGQFSTRANLGHASNTKGPLRRKTCTPKTAMTPVVATIRLRRSSPRSRGPPSQSESYVWDKALICRRPGESNSSI